MYIYEINCKVHAALVIEIQIMVPGSRISKAYVTVIGVKKKKGFGVRI